MTVAPTVISKVLNRSSGVRLTKTIVCLALAAALALSASVGRAQAAAGTLQAGASKVDITPTPDEFPYVQGREKAFVGVHDPLFVRALVLDDGKRRVALISIEVTTVPMPEEMSAAASQTLGLPASSIMLSASHTHEAPLVFFHSPAPDPVQAKEIARIKQAIVTAAQQALANLQPATIAFARGQAFININNGEEKRLTTWNDPTGPSDKSLDVIRLQTRTGAPLALIVNYASHSEVMFRSVTKDGGYEVTGDISGRTAHLLEDSPKGAPVVFYTPAAEADQLPIFKSLEPAGELPASDEGAAGWALLDVQSRRLASSVIDTLATMPAGNSNVSLAAGAGTVSCPGQQWRRDPATGAASLVDHPPVTIHLQVVRIGDIALAGVGGDLGTAIGGAIKAASPVAHTTVVSQIAGTVGYILPDAAYVHPGHGLMGSLLKPGCAQSAIVGGLRPLLSAN